MRRLTDVMALRLDECRHDLPQTIGKQICRKGHLVSDMQNRFPDHTDIFAEFSPRPNEVAPEPSVMSRLTQRQRQVMDMVLAGHPSKNIAADLGISQRTVENHRAAVMRRTGATSLPALARLAIGAEVGGDCKSEMPD